SDANYVENVMFERKDVVFVTLNLPGGSNNDADPWYKTPSATAAQTHEMADRTGADLRWLDTAFALAQHDHAAAVVIIEQADMWDRDGNAVSHLANYEPVIAGIASHATAFGGLVLLFNGDSHIYRSDNPLKQGQPCVTESGSGVQNCTAIADSSTWTQDAWNNYPSPDVSNFHRVTVHGSTFPLEWLKLTVNPEAHNPAGANAFGPCSGRRVQP